MRAALLLALAGCGAMSTVPDAAADDPWRAVASNPAGCPGAETSGCVGDGSGACPAGTVCRYERSVASAVVTCGGVCKTYDVK